MHRSNMTTSCQVDNVFVRRVDCKFCSIVTNTGKVGTEEREHNRHGGLGQHLIMPLSDKVCDQDKTDDARVHDLIAKALSHLLEGYIGKRSECGEYPRVV